MIEKVVEKFPSEKWLLIEDNLPTHHSRDVKTALLAWPEIGVQFIPKYACWLNLIEPWWKQLKSLALKGRRFETQEELTDALESAVCWWNAHKHPYHWKKQPQKQPIHNLGAYGSIIEKNLANEPLMPR